MALTVCQPPPPASLRGTHLEAASQALAWRFAASTLALMMVGALLQTLTLFMLGLRRMPEAVPPAWTQAYHHAEIFGFVGSALLGLGWYWLGRNRLVSLWIAHLGWLLWTCGVALRCVTDLYGFEWRLALPACAALELAAYAVFVACMLRHSGLWWKRDAATMVALGGAIALAIVLVLNAAESGSLAFGGQSRLFSAPFDRRFLLICTWGFVATAMWGLSAKWLPRMMGLKPTRTKILAAAGILDAIGIAGALAGKIHFAAVLLLHAAIFAPSSLKVFGKRVGECELADGLYVRLAYVWLRIAATLGVWASVHDAPGIWGASRHALTTGFVGAVILVLAPQFLPRLFDTECNRQAASAALALLNVGTLAHVFAMIFAYQGYARWAWTVLPMAGAVELAAFAICALNLAAAMARRVPAVMILETLPADNE